jgi:C1A family cysteine protease
MTEFINGVLKDIYDARDHIATSVYRNFGIVQGGYPTTLDLRSDLPSVRSQGSRGTCAAFAASCLKEWQEKTDSGYTGYMSPEFIYFYRSNKPNHGMYSRDVMSILLNKGCCSEGELPYDEKNVDGPTEISATFVENAQNYRIKEYARVLTIEDLKTSLYQNGPCYISFPVYNQRPEFWRQANGENSSGGHAVTVVGYDNNGFIIRNSWGTSFGDKGYVIYSYGDFGAHWDIWTVIDIRGSPKLPPQPENKKLCPGCIML